MSSIQFGRAGRDFAFAEVRASVSDADGAYGFDSVIPGGVVDLERAAFRTPGINVQIVTTLKGRDRLIAAGVNRLDTTEVTVLDDSDLLVAPATIFKFLRTTQGVRLLLHEGGPTLFGQFVASGLVNEFFLTMAPQIAGRNLERPRPAMVESRTVQIVPQTTASFSAGLNLYRARLDRGYSLTDCISMETKRHEGIADVLTNDGHFEKEDFREFFPPNLNPSLFSV